jgi:hypothetical protein
VIGLLWLDGFLKYAATVDEVEDEDNDGDHKQQMNPCAEDVEADEANQPEH